MAVADAVTFAVFNFPLNEASGSALETVGGLDATERSTVGTGTGLFGPARDFEASENDGFTRADHADLSVGDIDFCLVAWIKPETVGFSYIVAKGNTAAAANVAYGLSLNASNQVRFVVGNGAGTFGDLVATTFGALTAGSTYLLVAYHDATNNEMGISVNGGAYQTLSYSGGGFDDSGSLVIGDLLTSAGFPFDGLIWDVTLLKGYILDAAEVAELYNGGTGVAFADWDAGGGGATATVSVTTSGATVSAAVEFDPGEFASTVALVHIGATAVVAAEFDNLEYNATASPSAGGATAAAAATHEVPEFSATASPSNSGATVSAASTFDAGEFSATVSTALGGTTVTAAAEHTVPEYEATAALTHSGATAAASVTFNTVTFEASAAVDAGGITAEAAASFDAGEFMGTVAGTVGAATGISAAVAEVPTYSGSATPTAGAATVAVEATYELVFEATLDATVGAAIISATCTFISATLTTQLENSVPTRKFTSAVPTRRFQSIVPSRT